MRIHQEQAEKLIEGLALDGFFERSQNVEGKSIAYSGPEYVLGVQAPGVFRLHHDRLGWDGTLRRRLYALRDALDGEAAQALDRVIRVAP